MAELRMTADAETATPAAGAKRTVAAAEKKGLAIQDLILVAVLLAAGAVLKLTVGSLLASFGMKPNFIIAASARPLSSSDRTWPSRSSSGSSQALCARFRC
ncbi:hypothetical protein [Adlercreutzia sp.]|uniref:hypothetical protein n=1 Tax=Adlercreutzia sp. TaxID=1872387 RepID=UPI003A8CF699